MRALNINARLSVWHRTHGGGGSVQQVFNNQALNTLFDYGSRASAYLAPALEVEAKRFPLNVQPMLENRSATEYNLSQDVFITDPHMAMQSITTKSWNSLSPGCVGTQRQSSPTGSGTVAAHSLLR